jgi:hypothetical protein
MLASAPIGAFFRRGWTGAGRLCSGEWLGLGHAQVGHTVEGGTADSHFGLLSCFVTAAQGRTKDRFEAEHGCLGQGTAMVAALPLPFLAANLRDTVDGGVALLPPFPLIVGSILPWWNSGDCLPSGYSLLAGVIVIAAIGRDLRDCSLHLHKQRG